MKNLTTISPLPKEVENRLVKLWKIEMGISERPDRLNKKTSEEDAIVKAHDESVRDRSEAVDPQSFS